MRIIVAIIILNLLVSNIAVAGVSETPFFSVDRIRISDNTGLIYIQPKEKLASVNKTCSNSNLLALSKDFKLFQELYSAVHSAGIANKKIKVWLSTDENDCFNGYQKVRLIEVDF
ncbi:hypothetical protein [Pseudoalteromonas fuliginea]|uniref:hypothetical protein n=1 Tax=Pseudoalteromonas fuliginea TaxID=1872678 RepID=UPI003181717D